VRLTLHHDDVGTGKQASGNGAGGGGDGEGVGGGGGGSVPLTLPQIRLGSFVKWPVLWRRGKQWAGFSEAAELRYRKALLSELRAATSNSPLTCVLANSCEAVPFRPQRPCYS